MNSHTDMPFSFDFMYSSPILLSLILPMSFLLVPYPISNRPSSVFMSHLSFYSCLYFFLTKDLSHHPYEPFCAFLWFKHTIEFTYKITIAKFSTCIWFIKLTLLCQLFSVNTKIYFVFILNNSPICVSATFFLSMYLWTVT